MDQDFRLGVARDLLKGVRLERFVGDDGRPTAECWERLEAGTLSGGELVLVALALAVIDYVVPGPPVKVSALMRLDNDNLLRAATALAAVASSR
jgi:hypothetical protein